VDRFIPVGSFEHDTQPVLIVDDDGTIRLVNRAARRLVDAAVPGAPSLRCWDLFGFRAPDGSAFCGPNCKVQSDARAGLPCTQHWVVASKGNAAGRMMEMVTFVVPSRRSERVAVLHLLRPVAGEDVKESQAAPAAGTDRDELLTPACDLTDREGEVLRRIAGGASTTAVAEELGITKTTVRNHVQRILRKLGVHRRIEAALAFRRRVVANGD
jgi:DNA-binding CsgD family transcriptional regulator